MIDRSEAAAKHRARREASVQAGLCIYCRKALGPQREGKYRTCRQCADRHKHDSQEIIDLMTGYEHKYKKRIKCKREGCNVWFDSMDYRKNTRCAECRDWQNKAEETLAFENARFAEDMTPIQEAKRGRSHLKKGMKRSRAAWNQAIKSDEDDYRGLPVRHLTKAEIAKQYNAEKVAAIIKKAKANKVANTYPPFAVL